MVENYNRIAFVRTAQFRTESHRQRAPMDLNLHSLPRRLIELRIEHADLDDLIDQAAQTLSDDELSLRRLKKRRLRLRDQIAQLEAELDPPEPA
jgi:hypothetical protein